MASKIRVADYLAQALVQHGVQHVFMLTGGGAMHLNDALGHTPGLQVVCCHHEQTLAMAADAYTRLTNRVACVNVTTGPGALNALNGVFGAYVDSIGMVVVSGQVKRETILTNTGLPLRQLGDQEVRIVDMVGPITKMAVLMQNPQEVRYVIEKALWLASSGRPGPCWIDVPVDVQAALVDPDTLRGFDPLAEGLGEPYALPAEAGRLRGARLEEACDEVLERLKTAKRPVILAGMGVRLSGAYDSFLNLIDRLGVPVATCWNAHDLLPNAHPLYAGRPGPIGERAGNFAVQNADLVIILGSRMSIRQVGYNYRSFARQAFQIMVDIDKVEMQKPTLSIDMPIHADLRDFIEILQAKTQDYVAAPEHGAYVAWTKQRLARYPANLPEYWDTKGVVNPYCFAEELFRQLEENDIIVTGDGTACTVTFQVADLKQGQRLFHNNGCASMGFDVPAAIGAAWAAPNLKRIISIAGDGSVMQNIQELQTIVGQKLPVKLFVLNNDGYHSIRQTQQNFFDGKSVGVGPESGVTFPSFERLAYGFDMPYVRANDHADLASAIAATLAQPGPVLCEVMLDKGQVFAPKLGSRRLEDGSMITSPLEDMSPLLSREELQENMLTPIER